MTEVWQDFSRRDFRSPDVPDRRWMEWFREEYGRHFYKIEIEPCADTPFKLESAVRILPDLAIAQGSRSPMRSTNRDSFDDSISMIVPLAGRALVVSDGRSYELAANTGLIGRQDTAASIEVPEGVRLLSIRMRRRMLEPLIEELGSFRLMRDSQAMQLLLGYIRMIETETTITAPDVQHLVTTHVHDLVALAFGATRDAEGLIEGRGKRAGRLAAIKQDILGHLADPDLSVVAVAARQALSPRYIHKLFELEGATYSEFVVGRRLARAHRMLGDPRYGGQSISTIALGVGFGDLSYFNRTFRRRFGATPSDVRSIGCSGSS
jgi:AraC-like DNA-binding protein